MNDAAVLALIADLYTQVRRLSAELDEARKTIDTLTSKES